jgi:hypothetical protein
MKLISCLGYYRIFILDSIIILNKPGYRSRYRDRLRAGRPRFNSRQGQEIFLLSTASRPVLGSIHPPVKYDISPGGKAAGTWSWPLTYNYYRGQEYVDLYIHSPYLFTE